MFFKDRLFVSARFHMLEYWSGRQQTNLCTRLHNILRVPSATDSVDYGSRGPLTPLSPTASCSLFSFLKLALHEKAFWHPPPLKTHTIVPLHRPHGGLLGLAAAFIYTNETSFHLIIIVFYRYNTTISLSANPTIAIVVAFVSVTDSYIDRRCC